jgi:UDPglucose 6-dehydrogenase
MKIAVIGSGYVGLVSGACFAALGHKVICVDQNAEKIEALNAGKIPIYEPDLEGVVKETTSLGNLEFSTDLSAALQDVEAVFIAVGTPTNEKSGHADLTYVFDAGRQIARQIKNYVVVVIKSTVPVGTAQKLKLEMTSANSSAQFDVASNPEFLREGNAVSDFMNPDRVVVGVKSAKAEALMRLIYKPMSDRNIPILFTSSESAELIKYAANCYLAMRIGFVNQIADLCEVVGADISEVAKGTGMDDRIGTHYFAPGPGFGGSCFPKDTRALAAIGRDAQSPMTIIEEVISANEDRLQSIAMRIAHAVGGDLRNKKIAVLGIAFKADTDDLRDAASLAAIPALQSMGAKISCYDPVAMDHGRKIFSEIEWTESPNAAAKGADAIVILTEWSEFKSIDFSKMKTVVKTPLVIDFRNLYEPETVVNSGFSYFSIGRMPRLTK